MDWSEILSLVNRVLNTVLFTLSGRPVTLVSVLVFAFILLLTVWIARLLDRASIRALRIRGVHDTGVVSNLGRLVHYFVIVSGFALAAQNLGFDLDALFAAGAVFAVALGFAMQGMVQNFVSGVILLAERTIKVLKRTVPPAVPGIAFLSGGQSDEDATAHLSLMNQLGVLPWGLSFSYGRALQAAAQKAWSGKSENVAAGQRAFSHRAKMNGAAALGKWTETMEKAA